MKLINIIVITYFRLNSLMFENVIKNVFAKMWATRGRGTTKTTFDMVTICAPCLALPTMLANFIIILQLVNNLFDYILNYIYEIN